MDANGYTFRATGSVQKFDGYLAAYQSVKDEEEKEDEGDAAGNRLPQVREGEQLKLETIRPDQHFHRAAGAIHRSNARKELEEKGIVAGRLRQDGGNHLHDHVEREYVTKDQGRFTPTMLGERVSVLLVKSFEDIFDVGFTARLEEELDEIEEGKLPWRQAVKEFWDPFLLDLDRADGEMLSYKAGIPTGQKCEKCGQGELLERIPVATDFSWVANRYPECDFIKDLSPELPGRYGWANPRIESWR